MSFIRQHRRLTLDGDITFQAGHIFRAPACHKGNASTTGDTTTSQQSGAQTAGVNGSAGSTSGSTSPASVNTGTLVNPITVAGSGNKVSTVTTDDNAVANALNLVQNVLTGVQSSVTNASNDSAIAQIGEAAALASQPQSTTGTTTIGGMTINTNTALLAIAALAAVGIGVMVLRKK